MTNQNPGQNPNQYQGAKPDQDPTASPNEAAEPPFAAENSEAPGAPSQEADEGEDLGARIQELTALVDILKNERLMALAEAENAGKRADKRIADNAKYAVSNVCKSLLQVADNLGRALMAAPPEARAQNEMLNNLAVGVDLTAKELVMLSMIGFYDRRWWWSLAAARNARRLRPAVRRRLRTGESTPLPRAIS